MKDFGWRYLALNSALVLAVAALAETRPQYGGMLRVTVREAPSSLDPADTSQPDSIARRSIVLLVFETLVTLDESGRPRPALAESWQTDSGNRRWQLHLRRGVRFHDGTLLTAEAAAVSLRAGNSKWNVSTTGDVIVIEQDAADPELPSELALPRNGIAKRDSTPPVGTGPFRVADWQPGKKLMLAANENYWGGRPFLDGIEIEMGKNFRDQATALELGKSDLVELPPEQAHRATLDRSKVEISSPMELLALTFSRDPQTPDEKLLRESLALSIERNSIRTVLLQGAGEAAASLLPNWISGYAFVFPIDADLPRARHLREQVRSAPTWTIGYDTNDSTSRLLAERISLNAKDAGLMLQPSSSSTTDLRIVRIPLASADARVALTNLADRISIPAPKIANDSTEDLYAAEQSLLATQRVIPLFHLPVSYAAVAWLKGWRPLSDGTWNLAAAWLGSRQP